MDATDKIILNALQKDAKLNMKVLADELNISKSPLYDRVKRLENEKYISHYAAIVNKDKVGKPLVVFFNSRIAIELFILAMPFIRVSFSNLNLS